jgi:hypothetical protein
MRETSNVTEITGKLWAEESFLIRVLGEVWSKAKISLKSFSRSMIRNRYQFRFCTRREHSFAIFFCRLLFVRNFDESCCLSPLSRLESWFLFFAGLQISLLLRSAWWMLFCHSAPHSTSNCSLNDADLLHLDELPSFVLQQRSIVNSVSPWKRRKWGWSLLQSCSYPPPIRNLL